MKPFGIIKQNPTIQKYNYISITHEQPITVQPIITHIYQPLPIYKNQYHVINKYRSGVLTNHIVNMKNVNINNQNRQKQQVHVQQNGQDIENVNNNKIAGIQKQISDQNRETTTKKQIKQIINRQNQLIMNRQNKQIINRQNSITNRLNNSVNIPHRIPIFHNKSALSAGKDIKRQQKTQKKASVNINMNNQHNNKLQQLRQSNKIKQQKQINQQNNQKYNKIIPITNQNLAQSKYIIQQHKINENSIIRQKQQRKSCQLSLQQNIKQSSSSKHIPIFKPHHSPDRIDKLNNSSSVNHQKQQKQKQKQISHISWEKMGASQQQQKYKIQQKPKQQLHKQLQQLSMVKVQSYKQKNKPVVQQKLTHKPIFSKQNKIYHAKAVQINPQQKSKQSQLKVIKQQDNNSIHRNTIRSQQSKHYINIHENINTNEHNQVKDHQNKLKIESGVHQIKIQSDLVKTRRRSQKQSINQNDNQNQSRRNRKLSNNNNNMNTSKKQPQYQHQHQIQNILNQSVNNRIMNTSQISQMDQHQHQINKHQYFSSISSISLKSNPSHSYSQQADKQQQIKEYSYASLQHNRQPIKLSGKQSPNRTFKKIVGIGKNKHRQNTDSSKRNKKIQVHTDRDREIKPFTIQSEQPLPYTIPKALTLKPRGIRKSEQYYQRANMEQMRSNNSSQISIKIISIAQMKPLQI